MKEVKAMIPIITLVLLICVLAGTFAWFSSFQQVDMMGLLSVENPQEVVLTSSTLTPGSLAKYNGQKGYDNKGNIKTLTDAPYVINFDVSYYVVGDSDVDVSFGFDYIAIRLDAQKALPFSDVVRIVFGDSSFVDNAANREAYLGVKGSYKYDPNEVGGADYFDNTGKHLENATITTYRPKNEANNADKKGFLITKDVEGTGDVTEVIIKSEYVAEYFHLTYARYQVQYNEGNKTYEFVDGSAKTDVRFATPIEHTSTPNTEGHSEVNLDAGKCIPQKSKITIGLYHDFGSTPVGNASQFGEFVFSNDVFRGCTFVFSFKISSEKVSA